MTPGARLVADKLRFHRGGRAILAGASLSIAAGELVALLGANGAGKTTLLRLLLGLERPTGGSVSLDGEALSQLSRRKVACRVAYVPQAHEAPFPYPVREVVAMGRLPAQGLFGRVRAADREAVEQVLERLGIASLAGRPYTALSGGERQLALVARALAQDASLLVMDEPSSALDFGNQIRLLERLRALAGQGIGIVMSTHHPDQAAFASTRVAVLAGGVVAWDGPPAEIVTPETIRRVYGVEVRPAVFVPA